METLCHINIIEIQNPVKKKTTTTIVNNKKIYLVHINVLINVSERLYKKTTILQL